LFELWFADFTWPLALIAMPKEWHDQFVNVTVRAFGVARQQLFRRGPYFLHG
jgi:hypothetical protein